MKFLKKIVSVLLAAMIITGAFAPSAFAQDEVNWDEFYFTKQPEDAVITNGESFSFSVEVNAPEGVELSYLWIPSNGDGDSATITFEKGDNGYPETDVIGLPEYEYYCMVTATQKDSEGNIISEKIIKSDTATLGVKLNALDGLAHIFVYPWSGALGLTAALTGLTMGLALPLAPLIFVGSLVVCFAGGIKDVIESAEL